MAYEVVMPKMGESIVEGTIVDWKKKVGEYVSKDETLLEISTDKVDSEIPSPQEGVVLKILFEKNDTVAVGEVIALIGEKNETIKQDLKKEEKDSVEPLEVKLDESEPIEKINKKPAFQIQGKFYSPLVKSIAKKEGVDLADLENINGSGVNGRVNKKDILEYIKNRSPLSSNPIGASTDESLAGKIGKIEPMSHIRKIIASHMVNSVKESPHVYSSVEVDVTSIVDYVKSNRKKYLEQYDLKLTYTPIFVEACVKSIEKFPLIIKDW